MAVLLHTSLPHEAWWPLPWDVGEGPAWYQPSPCGSSATGQLSFLAGQVPSAHRKVLQGDQIGLNSWYVGVRDNSMPQLSICLWGGIIAVFLPSKCLVLWLNNRNNAKG